MIFHKHHLIPKHAGGQNTPENLVKVNVAMHAFLHKLRYEEKGDIYDYISYRALSSQITIAEAASEARKEFQRRNPEHHSKAGKLGAEARNSLGFSEESREKSRALATELGKKPWWNNGLNNKRSHNCPGEGYVKGKLPHGKHRRTYENCPYCGFSCNLSNLSRHILSKQS